LLFNGWWPRLSDPVTTILETERLQLREATLSDARFFVQLLNDPGWLRNIGDRGIRSESDAATYIRNSIWVPHQTHGYGMYVVQSKAAQTPIGLCGLVKRDYLSAPDLGFALLPDFSGQGYAFEAAVGVMSYARDTLDIQRLYAIVNSSNDRSIRLLGRLGFDHDGPCTTPQGAVVERYVASAREWLNLPTIVPQP
jgi:[ribosomal protein S5]-alanine N-acetyltransferase